MRVGSKRVGVFGAIGIVAVALFATGAVTLYSLQARSLEGVEQRARAAALLNDADRAVLTLSSTVLSILEFDDSTEAGRQAPVDFLDASRGARAALAAAEASAGAEAPEVASFRMRLDGLTDKARTLLAIGNAIPGLTRGADLSASDLTALASGARLAAQVTVELQALSRDISAHADRLFAENLEAAQWLARRGGTSVLLLAAAGVAALWAVWAGARRDLLLDLIRRRQERRQALAFEIETETEATSALALDTVAILAEEETNGPGRLVLFPSTEPSLPSRTDSLRDPQAWTRPQTRYGADGRE